jgi:prepilin-type N-terminal cleavage/methylation domain-containing protein
VFSRDQSRIGARSSGFTLLELLIALGVVLIVAAIVTPQAATFINNYKLRSSASQLAGMVQQCRINSVRTNSVIGVQSAIVGGRQQIWVDLNGDGAYNQGEPLMQLPVSVTLQNAGFPGNATTGLGTGINWQVGSPVRFTARGIPCRINAGNCVTDGGTVGFVYYLRNIRGPGNSWAAVRVNPIGRITAVTWSGSTYQ